MGLATGDTPSFLPLCSPHTLCVSPGVTSQGNHSPPTLVSGSPPAKPTKTHGLSQPGERSQSAARAGEPAAFPAEVQAPGPAPARGWRTRSSPRRPSPAPLMGLDAGSRLRADSGATRSGRGQRPRAPPLALLGGVTCWPLSRLEGFRACPQPLAWPGGGVLLLLPEDFLPCVWGERSQHQLEGPGLCAITPTEVSRTRSGLIPPMQEADQRPPRPSPTRPLTVGPEIKDDRHLPFDEQPAV